MQGDMNRGNDNRGGGGGIVLWCPSPSSLKKNSDACWGDR